MLCDIHFKVPYIGELIRDMDCPAVEDYNDFAEDLEGIWQKDGMLLTYAAVLEAEKPETLHRACELLRNLDNYQRITEGAYGYGQQRLQETLGLDDEAIYELDGYDPARFLDYKLEVLQMLLFCLPRFDPVQETEFLKYAKHYIQDGLLFCRMMGEAGSFSSLAEYRRVRKIGAIYNDSGKSCAEVVSEFAVQSGYKDESVSADELLTIAQRNRSIVSLYRTEQDEDSEETGEDVTRDDSWNYAEILWNGIQAKAVTAAFEQLSYKEQWYLEKRNAICMTCGRVSPLSAQSTFEDLAVDFEGTTASGAERFYRRTLDKLRLKLFESGLVHTVTLKQTECRKKNKKIAAAVYQYQADNDGEWGEIRFDFENDTAEIVRLADRDTVKSNILANTAIRFVQRLPEARLLKSVVVPFEMERLDLI